MPDDGAFRSMKWAVELPVIRTAKGHVDHVLHRVAVALALHADGRTGENAFPSQKTIARCCGADSLSTVADALARGEALGLWEADEDASPWGTTQWHLAIDDEQLIDRLEKAEMTRLEHKRSLKSAKNRRHYEGKAGIQSQSTGSDEFSPSGRGLKTQRSGSSAPEDRVLRRSGPGLKTHSGLDNQPYEPALVDQPFVDQPSVTATSAAAPTDESLADRLIDRVLPHLGDTDTRHAHSVLMKFADRWPNAMEIVDLAFTLAPGQIELDHFEADDKFAVPLTKKLEAKEES